MPRCGAVSRKCAVLGACSGTAPFGERKESSPQRRAPPRSGLLGFTVLSFVWGSFRVFAFVLCAFGVRPRTTPLLVFIREYVVSLPLRISVASVYGGAHPLVMDALAEMPEAQIPYVLAPRHPCAHIPPAKDRRSRGRGSLQDSNNLNY